MKEPVLTKEDIRQIESMGMTKENVNSQIETFKRGTPFLKLDRPCISGDGIEILSEEKIERLTSLFDGAASEGRVLKFTPASGAASRKFKLLKVFNNRYDQIKHDYIFAEAEKNKAEYQDFLKFIKGLKRFAFYNDLKAVMSNKGLDIETLISKGEYKDILENILTDRGLNYAHLPKGLIKFHSYGEQSLTPFEEHLVEAMAYARDSSDTCRIHFTVSDKYMERIKAYLDKNLKEYEKTGKKVEIGYSIQKPSTDTIAMDMDDRPFRGDDGSLLFRPGGHGALIENMNDLKGDIIFIKNIDNVVPDRLKNLTYKYKKALGGYLVELQNEVFRILKGLSGKDIDKEFVANAIDFAKKRLYIDLPEEILDGKLEEKRDFIFTKLNRPLRVCGMVKNEGEPGGGPFWVRGKDGSLSLQIVEKTQVDTDSKEQGTILDSSTHFNPVDLICAVRNYQGQPFDLSDFTDPETGFISIKSDHGKKLKALELPGLWNGAMANWNTVFVEVPIITFNPVKTVLDLLRKEHQQE